MNIQPIQKLLESEVDRKEFLAYLGAAALAVFGVTGLLNSISQLTTSKTITHSSKKQMTGYGKSPYGQ